MWKSFLDNGLFCLYNVGRMNRACTIKTKVTIHGEESFFGPGIVELLKLVGETGSVKLACSEMKLSYTKAWTIINRAEKELGYALINRSQGGKAGGGASLTEEGRQLILNYEELSGRINEYANKAFGEIFPDGL